jgi:prepilin-type processing-associated H-X9-DG protein
MTLIEVLVVVAIVGMLIGLLLPSLQATREASRRGGCVGKMRQVGIALHGYAEANGVLPPAVEGFGGCSAGTPPPAIKNMNGLVLLLPMLEEQALFDRLRMHEAFREKEVGSGYDAFYGTTPLLGYETTPLVKNPAIYNYGVTGTCPAALTCPSEPERRSSAGMTSYDPRRRTNYDFVVPYISGTECMFWARCNDWGNPSFKTQRSMFADGSACRWAHVTDGLSTTAMMAETRRLCCSDGKNTEWAQRRYTAFGLSLAARTPNTTLRCSTSTGYCSSAAGFPNPTGVGCCRDDGRELADYGTTGSNHPGGIGLLMADGSVRFFGDDAGQTIRQRLERIADGQIVVDF